MNDIKIMINDQEVAARAGQTILQAAQEAGIHIPTLCFHPALQPSGSCRLCAVEIEGYRGLPAGCSTEVAAGMRIWTDTAKVQDFRREMLRIILQDHPRECLSCSRNGTCELQQLVTLIGIDFPYPPPEKERPPAKPAGRYFERDYSLCVRCGRCVRVCHEMRGARAIVFRDVRGRQEVATPLDLPLEEAGCQFCGACVDVCPTGALHENMVSFQSEPRGHIEGVCRELTDIVYTLYKQEIENDWKSAVCPSCSAGCRLTLEITGEQELFRATPDPAGASNKGQACVQGRFRLKTEREEMTAQRSLHPMVATDGSLQGCDWNTALDAVAKGLGEIGGDQVGVMTDGRATNEELFALAQWARQGLQTESLGILADSGERRALQCLQKLLGTSAASFSLDDLDQCETILAIGFNPAATHPIAGSRIRQAVLHGAKLVVANPYEVSIARYADAHLPYLPGSEQTLLLGLLKSVLDSGTVPPSVQDQYGEALEKLGTALEGYDPKAVCRCCAVELEGFMAAADLLAVQGPVAILFGAGLLHSPELEGTLEALVGLARISDSFGHPGGGIYPAFGACNQQGAADMGFTTDVIDRIQSGRVKGLFLCAETLASDLLADLAPALNKLEFLVVQSCCKVPDAIHAKVTLPLASLLEKEGSLTNSDRLVQWSEPAFTAPEDARTLLETVRELALRGGETQIAADARRVFEQLGAEIAGYQGIGYHRARFEPVCWPCPDPQGPGSTTLFIGQPPELPAIVVPSLAPQAPEPSDEQAPSFPFALVAKESLLWSYEGPLLAPEALAPVRLNGAIEMNPADAYTRGYQPGDEITVSLPDGTCQGTLAINKLLPQGMIVAGRELLAAATGERDCLNKAFAARVEDLNS